jgi:predicted DNA-binding transcriptional regulator AlpA
MAERSAVLNGPGRLEVRGECPISLDALLADPSRAAQVPREEAVALLIQLATLHVALLTAASRPPSVAHREAERPEEDRMLAAKEVAKILGVPPRWLYSNWKTLPFARKLSPKVLRFSRAGLLRHLGMKRL